MKSLGAALIIAATVSTCTPAFAAPFCTLQTGIPLQCLYSDPGVCEQEAEQQGGRCVANPNEYRTPPITSGQFCVVESSGVATCYYPDYGTCVSVADERGGACIAASPAPPPKNKGFDPYEVKRPY
jgi:hypothetical protein